jgi:hypothetical protein
MIPSGNINKDRFRSIWNSNRQKNFRKIGFELSNHPGFVDKVGCVKSCDNVMHNAENLGLMKKLAPDQLINRAAKKDHDNSKN